MDELVAVALNVVRERLIRENRKRSIKRSFLRKLDTTDTLAFAYLLLNAFIYF